jgi:hypothetical protein
MDNWFMRKQRSKILWDCLFKTFGCHSNWGVGKAMPSRYSPPPPHPPLTGHWHGIRGLRLSTQYRLLSDRRTFALSCMMNAVMASWGSCIFSEAAALYWNSLMMGTHNQLVPFPLFFSTLILGNHYKYRPTRASEKMNREISEHDNNKNLNFLRYLVLFWLKGHWQEISDPIKKIFFSLVNSGSWSDWNIV